MRDHEDEDHYEPGELFVYVNGDRWGLGMVKRPAGDGHYFCWYSCGDTAARTSTINMCKLENAGFTHVEKLLESAERAKAENAKLRERVEWLDGECRKRMGESHKFFEMVGEYQKENAKLRDFAKLYLAAVDLDCNLCPYCDPELCDTETDPMSDGCRLWEEMRELRVEVEP